MAALAVSYPVTARGHDPGLSSLDVRVEPARISAELSLSPSDARIASTGGGVTHLALQAIEMRVDGAKLEGLLDGPVRVSSAGTRVTLSYERRAGSRLSIGSRVAERLVPGHRQLVTVRYADGRVLAERMFDVNEAALQLDLTDRSAGSGAAGRFVALGIRHILGGYDHLLFLAALLLGVTRFTSVIRTVTSFTAAHSITLALAVLGVVRMPSALIEPLIAASIVFVGMENLVRQPLGARAKLTFAFGLVHGFGFAGALTDLGIGGEGTIAVPLASFNLGVEAGQIAVVTALWPLILMLQARSSGRFCLARICSGFVVAAGAFWLIERTIGSPPV
jgi:hypothetical protein